MNGPEHYLVAERLVAWALEYGSGGYDTTIPEVEGALAAAQVHATLSHAAATALDPEDSLGQQAWRQAIRTPRPTCEHDGCTNEQSVSWDPYCVDHKADLGSGS